MRTLGIIVASIALLIGGVIVWWKITYPTYTYRYRLTLAIEVDGKVHTGSSVIEIAWAGQPYIPGAGSYIPKIRGQAALIDLGKHGVVTTSLIAPSGLGRGKMDWPEGVDAIFLVPYAFGVNSGDESFPQLLRLTGRRDLAPDNMPRLIWFSDIVDPKTARVIKPADMPALLGPSARITAAYVEITRDSVVIDIDKKLPWYQGLAARQKSTGIIGRPYEFQLSYPMFVGG